jgi:hypothetical protein
MDAVDKVDGVELKPRSAIQMTKSVHVVHGVHQVQRENEALAGHSGSTSSTKAPIRLWGNRMETSGLPCGNLGVTPSKTRRYPVEISGLPQRSKTARSSAKLLISNDLSK